MPPAMIGTMHATATAILSNRTSVTPASEAYALEAGIAASPIYLKWDGGHRFVNELFAGAVLDAVMVRYLIQDHRLLENTFFLRAFEALVVTEDRRAADPDTQPTAGFKAIIREAARNAQLCRCTFGPRRGRVAPSRLGLPRAAAVTGQLRGRRVGHADPRARARIG
jgi:hypothetical protein